MKLCIIGNVESVHLQKRVKWFLEKGLELHLINEKKIPSNIGKSTEKEIIPLSYSISNIDCVNLYEIGKTKRGISNFIGSLSSYVQIAEIKKVPGNIQYRIISRKQPGLSQSKLRRLIKRGSIKESEISLYEGRILAERLEGPYIDLISNSNGQRHRRYINFGPLLDNPKSGTFDFFGLSKDATIPWF